MPSADVVATDLNPPMVDYAAAKVPGPRWEVADAQGLRYADASFDLVVCQFGVMFLPGRVEAYRGVLRVLRPGGSFLFNAWDTLETHVVEAAVIEAMAEMFPLDPPDFLRRVPHGYADPERIREDVELAGLEVAELERVELTGHAPSAAALAQGYCLGTPLRFELAERGDPADAVAPLTAALSARFGDGPVEVSMSAHVVHAVLPVGNR
jgi:SAM-dependent methyltransferase